MCSIWDSASLCCLYLQLLFLFCFLQKVVGPEVHVCLHFWCKGTSKCYAKVMFYKLNLNRLNVFIKQCIVWGEDTSLPYKTQRNEPWRKSAALGPCYRWILLRVTNALKQNLSASLSLGAEGVDGLPVLAEAFQSVMSLNSLWGVCQLPACWTCQWFWW